MNDVSHLTTDDLVLFMDRELDPPATRSAEQHLLSCAECGARLNALKGVSSAQQVYHQEVLKASLQVPVTGWVPLGERLVGTDAVSSAPPKGTACFIPPSRSASAPFALPRRRIGWGFWGAAAALAGIAALAWFYWPTSGTPSAPQLIERAAAVPEVQDGEVVFSSNKYSFVRPAVLEAGGSEARFHTVQALFVKANYSWAKPLSARSFAAWRAQLAEKKDFVTAIHENNGRQFFRIATQTKSNILHSASLTFEAVSYRPTRASFEFAGEDQIEVYQRTNPEPDKPLEVKREPAASPPVAEETIAGPEDELRVFAALDAIGADAEEPIDVKLDTGHHRVLVTGMGMPADRRKQIVVALAALPKTIVRFSANPRAPKGFAPASGADSPAAETDAEFRQKLEDLSGGVRELQNITDQSLELSNALFAQSHSLLVLSHEFPASVEGALAPADAKLLLALRQRRLGAMTYALRRLKDQLKPLLAEDVLITPNSGGSSWQDTAAKLYEGTRNLDQVVSRLLAGSYTKQTGDIMLKELPEEVAGVESLIVADSR